LNPCRQRRRRKARRRCRSTLSRSRANGSTTTKAKEGIDVLTKGLQQAILSRGYVTTRVLVQPQDLTGGTLTLALVPGIVRSIAFADPSMWGTWKTAYPTRGHDVLNLRDLEQGLEQMKRVGSQDVSMEIRPTDVPGESDVVLTVKRAKPWTFVASVDNSGTESTGKWQGNVSLGIDNPLGLNDIFTVGANQDLSFGNKALGSHGFNGSYSFLGATGPPRFRATRTRTTRTSRV
jgi:hemolysin activation/secretion protein